MEPVRVIRMCLNETYTGSKAGISKHLYGLKQRNALSQFILNFALEYAI
jgi:hypothetical protein